MRLIHRISILGLALICSFVSAQTEDSEGIDLGWLTLQPEAGILGAYDDRVVLLSETKAEGDFYSEPTVGAQIRNKPARYQFSAAANYGYRNYSDYTDLNDDFYSAGVMLRSDDGRLNWGADSSIRKALNYETSYNPVTGDGPDSILSNEENVRSQTRAYLSYDQEVSERTSIVPEYSFWYYNHEFSGADREEWVVHRLTLPARYAITDKTDISAGVRLSAQNNENEDGVIGTLYAGAKGRLTDKSAWQLYLGVSAADYDQSGSEVSGVARGRLNWQTTEKINVYLFGGNAFEPGYGGGAARMVYRAGYGTSWRVVDQLSFYANGLHDYEREVGSDSSSSIYSGVRHFFTVGSTYSLPRWAELSLIGRYINDEVKVDQMIVSLELSARY